MIDLILIICKIIYICNPFVDASYYKKKLKSILFYLLISLIIFAIPSIILRLDISAYVANKVK
jgi:hypothetical protein